MFYLINKKANITSFWAIKLLRKKFNIKKIGHTGTLDPLATGLLLIATGSSTKLIPYLEKKEKTYIFSFNIDWFSTTWDLEWDIKFFDKEILTKKKKEITQELIKDILEDKFIWKINQIPPKYSAIKIDWKRSYELAREWKEVIIKSREIEIFNSKLLDYSFPKITIEMTVSAWTYIRVIAEDIGKELWLNWYTTYLHRTKIGTIWEELSHHIDSISIGESLDEKMLFPEFWIIEVNESQLIDILNWKELEIIGLVEWKKYLITYKWINKSLVEANNWKIVILRNWL